MIIPAALIALLTIGTNTSPTRSRRVALGVDRRPEEAALMDDLVRRGRCRERRPATSRGWPGRPSAGRSGWWSATWRSGSGRHGPAVVSEISFAVRPGEVLGLVGESGSGKTTVALALLGHARRGLSVSGGEVRLDGVDLLRLEPGELRAVRGAKVSYVPQDPAAALNPALRVGYQLREALRVHAGRWRATRRPGCARSCVRRAWTRRRRCCAGTRISCRAASSSGSAWPWPSACRPSLIVLDEPTTGLDVSTQRHILDTVRSLCRSYGVAAVYVSHDLAVVSGLVGEVAVMYAGRIVETGPPPCCSPSRCTPIPAGCSPPFRPRSAPRC